MVLVHDVERKVPCKVLEEKIDNVSYQYVVEATSSIDHCLEALEKIKEHIIEMKKIIEEKQAQEALEAQNTPQE